MELEGHTERIITLEQKIDNNKNNKSKRTGKKFTSFTKQSFREIPHNL